MRVLLTGAGGRIGEAVRQAAGDRHELLLVDANPSIARFGGHAVDVADFETMRHLARGCDAIIHLATIKSGKYKGANDTSSDFLRGDTMAADNLMDAAVQHGIRRVLVASTAMVYWDAGQHYGTAILDESLPPRPSSLYGLNKFLIEQIGQYYARVHGLEFAALRFCGVREGALQKLGVAMASHLISSLDAARAIWAVLEKPGLRSEIFCVGPTTPLTQADCDEARNNPAAVLERHWPGCMAVLQAHGQCPQCKDLFPVVRADKLRLMTGWQPQDTFESYLRSLGWAPVGEQPAAR